MKILLLSLLLSIFSMASQATLESLEIYSNGGKIIVRSPDLCQNYPSAVIVAVQHFVHMQSHVGNNKYQIDFVYKKERVSIGITETNGIFSISEESKKLVKPHHINSLMNLRKTKNDAANKGK